MPTPVNTQDATNFLNNGYVSRTVASRDGAGNIKLSADVTSTVNSTITVESVTSQFSTDTALKLFDTRFEYFKFPVQTVAASSLANIGTNINQEVTDSLAGVSFEQDVISRRLELIPSAPGVSKSWSVPPCWSGYFIYANQQNLWKGKRFNLTNRLNESVRTSLYNSFREFAEKPISTNPSEATSTLGKWISSPGFTTLTLSNGNSPNKPGYFRITPDMIKQIKAGGKISGTDLWKRNIKFRVKIKWDIDDIIKHGLMSGENVWLSGYNGASQATPASEKSHQIQNGVMFMIQLTAEPLTGRLWNDDVLPRFVQSTSNFSIGVPRTFERLNNARAIRPITYRKESTSPETLYEQIARGSTNRYVENADFQRFGGASPYVADASPTNPTGNSVYGQELEFDYVIDSRELLFIPPGRDREEGEYREYALQVASNYKTYIKDASWDIFIEELPSNIMEDTAYGMTSNDPKKTLKIFNPGTSEYKYNQYRSLFAFIRDQSYKIGGVRTIFGKNVLAGFNWSSNRVIGYTLPNNAEHPWDTLMSWDQSVLQWRPRHSFTKYTGNMNWNSNLFNNTYPANGGKGTITNSSGIITADLYYKYAAELDTPFILESK